MNDELKPCPALCPETLEACAKIVEDAQSIASSSEAACDLADVAMAIRNLKGEA